MDEAKEEKLFGELNAKNEVRSNTFTARTFACLSAICLALWILNLTGLIGDNSIFINIVMPLSVVMLSVPLILNIVVKGTLSWHKYLYFAVAILGMFGVSSAFNWYVVIVWALPIMLSCQYFNYRFTLRTTLFSEILMIGAFYLGLFFGLWDNNIMQGGQEVLGGLTRVEYIVGAQSKILSVATLKHLLPRLIIVIILSPICIFVADRSRRLLGLQRKELNIKEAETAEKARIDAGRAVYALMQNEVLPKISNFPIRGDYDLFADYRPAREDGGNFYDFLHVSENRIALVVGNVRGKGVPGVMFMVKAKATIKHFLLIKQSAAEALTEANNELLTNNTDMCVTACVVIINLRSGECEVVNAGAPNPIILKPQGAEWTNKAMPEIALGVKPNVRYVAYRLDLDRGNKLLLVNDGVAETLSANNEFFGKNKLIRAINGYLKRPIAEIVNGIVAELVEFSGGANVENISLLAFERKSLSGEKKL